MAGLTRDDVVAVLGRVDDFTIGEIITSGATRQEPKPMRGSPMTSRC